MTIFSTDASAGDSVARLVGDMFTDLSRVLLMSDDEMFAGLEARTVADLQQRLQENPALRPTLCRAGNYRAAHHSRSHRKPSRSTSSRPPPLAW